MGNDRATTQVHQNGRIIFIKIIYIKAQFQGDYKRV